MLSKHTNVYTGSVLLIQRPSEVADFVARYPQVLPTGKPVAQPTPSLLYRLALKLLSVVVVLALLLVLVLWFFLFGEERPEPVRPELTDVQRTQAFRVPTP